MLWLLLPLLHYYNTYWYHYWHYCRKRICKTAWHSLKKMARGIRSHRGLVFVVSVSRIDSIGEHQHALRHRRASLGLGVGRVSLLDVRKPSGAHGRAKLIAQGINGFSNCGPSVLPHVICKTKILPYLEIIRIMSISVISVISVIGVISVIKCIRCKTFSACVSVLNPKCQKMSSIK